jgi:hypothetical protein
MEFSKITDFFYYHGITYLKIKPTHIYERETNAIFMANAINLKTRKPEFFADDEIVNPVNLTFTL